jgi:VIT1/CCC1 family predicted Fe2+/Mn2+ transporter
MSSEPDPGKGRSTQVSGEAPRASASGKTGPRYKEKHNHIRGRGLISSSALGLSDGLITNLAFLTGFGAAADLGLIRFAGLAAMLAGTVSMFFGGILAARSELDLFKADSKREAYEIDNEREEEITELREHYMEKGLTEQEAKMVVDRVSAHKERFLEDMLVNELHIHVSHLERPYKLGVTIGLSFLLGALVPLVPYYVLDVKESALVASVLFSLVFLFSVGAWKGTIVGRAPWRSGLETLLIGAAAAGILFVIGTFLGFV